MSSWLQPLLRYVVASAIPLVIDADGLQLVGRDPTVLFNATAPIVLTPNGGEARRLYQGLCDRNDDDEQRYGRYARELSAAAGTADGVARMPLTVVVKGDADVITDGTTGSLSIV